MRIKDSIRFALAAYRVARSTDDEPQIITASALTAFGEDYKREKETTQQLYGVIDRMLKGDGACGSCGFKDECIEPYIGEGGYGCSDFALRDAT